MAKKAPTKSSKKPASKPAAKTASKAAPKKAVKSVKSVKAAPKATKSVKAVKLTKSVKTPKAGKSVKTGPKKGRGRVTSASGPLSTAVVKVLKARKRSLSCREITEALVKNKYQFTHPEPKRILSIRIYKLKGVKQTGPGLFTAA